VTVGSQKKKFKVSTLMRRGIGERLSAIARMKEESNPAPWTGVLLLRRKEPAPARSWISRETERRDTAEKGKRQISIIALKKEKGLESGNIQKP